MRLSIVIADDERENREVLGEVFERQGYRVNLAEDGLAALSMILERRPRLAILDYEMPGLNGIETLRTLRSRSATLPVLMMSSILSEEIRRAAANFGVEDFFEKPIDVSRIRSRVSGLIGEERAMTVHQMTTTMVVRRNVK